MFKRKPIDSFLQEIKYFDQYLVNDSTEKKGDLFIIEKKSNEDRIYELEIKVKELQDLISKVIVK
jgi:hypothetical protein